MNARRGFLKNFGLLGAVIAGASAPVVIEKVKEVHLPPPVPTMDPEVSKLLEEQGNSNLQLTALYGEIEPPKPPPAINGYNFSSAGGSLFIQPNGYTKSHLTIESEGNVVMGTNYKKFVPGTEKQVFVKMMPGPDGELYIQKNGEWRKVLTT